MNYLYNRKMQTAEPFDGNEDQAFNEAVKRNNSLSNRTDDKRDKSAPWVALNENGYRISRVVWIN